ncbi:MAG TPA: hypothetical protein VFF30_03030 [Nitrososphaerales archaeon]|nr:hypothetical protein [Nitrososphaerales archaeon]
MQLLPHTEMSDLEQQQPQTTPLSKEKNSSTVRRDNSSLVALSVTFTVFVALPYEMYVLGFPMLTDFAFTIFVAGLLADIFTTKTGFNRGYGDYNIFYNAGKKKRVRNNSFLAGTFVFGVIRAVLMFYFLDNTLILMIIATMSLIGPMWNSIILSAPDQSLRPPEQPQPL